MMEDRILKIEKEIENLKLSNEKLSEENTYLKAEILRVEAGKYECIDSILNELKNNKEKNIIKTALGLFAFMMLFLALTFVADGKSASFFAFGVIGSLGFCCAFLFFFFLALNILFKRLEGKKKGDL